MQIALVKLFKETQLYASLMFEFCTSAMIPLLQVQYKYDVKVGRLVFYASTNMLEQGVYAAN